MKTFNTFSLALAMFTFAVVTNDRALAQGSGKITRQAVDQFYAATSNDRASLVRETWHDADGTFKVRVIDVYGQVRMVGRYLDAQLTIADGAFSYYYENGQVESLGSFLRGNKSGVWERHARDGSRLADRMYLGLDAEQLQVALGMATEACTLSDELAAQR